jgi:prephenate dehydratase
VRNALDELRFFSKEVRILGVYPRSDSREEWNVAD